MTMLAKLKDKWFSSGAYRFIERVISARFRRRLKNKDFTLLSSNCVGGCIYHRLGVRFLSPTVNMSFNQCEFLQLCLHLEEYMKAELVFVESDKSFPVGRLICEGLPEINVNFVHYKSNEEAAAKWNERKVRINRENLYIVFYNTDGITEEELHLLDSCKCRNKALLNWRDMPEIPWSIHVDGGKKNDIMQRNLLGLRVYERKCDFVSFLNE